MLNYFTKELSKNVFKITTLKIHILNAIENQNYDLLCTYSVRFVKEAENALFKFMKYEASQRSAILKFFEIKDLKNSLFKILTCIVSLISRINNVLNDNNITRMNYLRYLEGHKQLSYLRENYIYILRK